MMSTKQRMIIGIEYHELEHENVEKLLGTDIEFILNCKNHIRKTCRKASREIQNTWPSEKEE